jgi:hypothetical protein
MIYKKIKYHKFIKFKQSKNENKKNENQSIYLVKFEDLSYLNDKLTIKAMMIAQ